MWARYAKTSPLKNLRAPGSNTASQKAGRRYESKILRNLKVGNETTFMLSPWIHYALTSGLEHHCQPDAILLRKDCLIIFEVKLTHTIDAYWQLRHLYAPAMRKVEPNTPQHLVEITRSFDPNCLYPETMRLFFDLSILLSYLAATVPDEKIINILQWKL